MSGRHQHVQQGHQVLHLAAVDQIGFFTNLGRDVQLAQFKLQRQQTGALARQHHHIRGLQATSHSIRRLGAGQLLRNPVRRLARLQGAQGFLRQFARGQQTVAPRGVGRPALVGLSTVGCGPRQTLWPCNRGQFANKPWLASAGGMRSEALVTIGLHRLRHDRVHDGDDPGGVAPGVVAAEQIALQTVAHKGLGRLEYLRLGPAKAVDALLGVTHDEHTRCRGARATA